MSGLERERLDVLRRLMRGELRQARAAELLGVGVRQVKRQVRGYRCEGEASVVSRRRGRPSNNRLDGASVATIEAALKTRSADFGATLASEKLGAIEGVRVSKETVRQIQIRLGLWRAKRRRAKKIFQVRERRPRFGELIQIDGSAHDWFEGRGSRCALIVFIDDATGRLTHLQFAPAETTKADLQALQAHVLAHGLPLAFSSDRHGIFRVNAKEAQGGDGFTEFGRVAERLRIELIHAMTPQAKGRVERANQPPGPCPGVWPAVVHRCGAGVRRRFPRTLEQQVRGRPAAGRGRPSAVVRLQRRSRPGSGAPGRTHALQGAHLQRRRDPLRRQDGRAGHGVARGQGHAAAHARRNLARPLQGPRPRFYPLQDLARPAAGRRRQDPRRPPRRRHRPKRPKPNRKRPQGRG
jgi:transposase